LEKFHLGDMQPLMGHQKKGVAFDKMGIPRNAAANFPRTMPFGKRPRLENCGIVS